MSNELFIFRRVGATEKQVFICYPFRLLFTTKSCEKAANEVIKLKINKMTRIRFFLKI